MGLGRVNKILSGLKIKDSTNLRKTLELMIDNLIQGYVRLLSEE